MHIACTLCSNIPSLQLLQGCKKEGAEKTLALQALEEKVNACKTLDREIKELREALEVKKKEIAKAGEDAKKYHDLYEGGNAQLQDVRQAYENLKNLVTMEEAKKQELKAKEKNAEVVKRETAAQAKVEQAKVEPKQENSPADKTKPAQVRTF